MRVGAYKSSTNEGDRCHDGIVFRKREKVTLARQLSSTEKNKMMMSGGVVVVVGCVEEKK
jgi:hypothetical protein